MRPTRNFSRRERSALGSHRPSFMTNLRGARRGDEKITPGIRRRSPRVTDRNDQTNRTDRSSRDRGYGVDTTVWQSIESYIPDVVVPEHIPALHWLDTLEPYPVEQSEFFLHKQAPPAGFVFT